MEILTNNLTTSLNFNFQETKKSLYEKLIKRSKTESEPFEEIIKNYNCLLVKMRGLSEKSEMLERENNSLKRISGDPVIMNDLQSKVQILEKELNETMKENKTTSSKLCEILTDKMMMKDQIDNLTKSNNTKQARLLELEEIVKVQDIELNKLRDDNQFLKGDNVKLEKQNIALNENLNKKIVENNSLINEILTIKNDYMVKMNEMLELVETAKKKKEAADIYFDEKQKDHRKNSSEINIRDSIKDFQIFVEDVQIPNKLKIKLTAHKKNITSLKFNNFGTNFLTTGVDTFIKIWDASKSKLYKIEILIC
jgi:WD40 repeat protein